MIERFLHGLSEKMEDPDDCSYMTVVVPGDIDPLERHHRFSVHVDAELRLTGLGCSVGGGTLFYERDDDGEGEDEIAFCILDVDAIGPVAARVGPAPSRSAGRGGSGAAAALRACA